jgi:plastocyanin
LDQETTTMSTSRIRNLSLVLGLLFLAAVAMAVRAVVTEEPAREITLHARDMAFYLPGDATPNPTLRVAAGEPVRFTLVNDEPGLQHDLAVAPAGLVIAALPVQAGSRASATIVAPEAPGRYPYVCTLHAQMMRGTLEVERAARD